MLVLDSRSSANCMLISVVVFRPSKEAVIDRCSGRKLQSPLRVFSQAKGSSALERVD